MDVRSNQILDEITARLNSLTQFAQKNVSGQCCVDCGTPLTAQNRAIGFGAICARCEELSR